MNRNYSPVIGLEVHIELSTQSKLFCSCPANHFGKKPNTQVCPVCMGLPGALPYVNKEAIDATVMFGLALGCSINRFSKFDRKHYFYPDLPKGYQISQYDLPFCKNGSFSLGGTQPIKIRRIHLEEDTGKLVHSELKGKKVSLVDFNRSSVPLVELVTEPIFDLTVPQIVDFLKELQKIARYLGISNADMEKGSMRLEANVSVSRQEAKGQKLKAELPNYKVELKNINSFKFLESAVKSEIERQTKLLQSGKTPIQETRGYNEATRKTFPQRTKEEAHDYRYFPEPDIPPIELSKEEVLRLKGLLPELPAEKRVKLEKLNLPKNYIEILTSDRDKCDYFEKALKYAEGKLPNASKKIANIVVNDRLLGLDPAGLAAKLLALSQIELATEAEVKKAILEAIEGEPDAVLSYKKGKEQVIGYFIGKVQSKLKGRGDIVKIKELLISQLRKK